MFQTQIKKTYRILQYTHKTYFLPKLTDTLTMRRPEDSSKPVQTTHEEGRML
jgi:hypothetical protein